MELHEYYVKEIFRQAGLPVLPGSVAYTPKEAEKVAKEIKDGPFWVKPQILYGYSYNHKPDPALLPKLAQTPQDVFSVSEQILGKSIFFQKYNKSVVIQRVYVEKALQNKTFCRFVFRVDFDRQDYTLTLITNKTEQTLPLSELKLTKKIQDKILNFSKIHDKGLGKKLKDILKKAFQLFLQYQAVAVELNPVIQDDKKLIVSEGRLIFDPDSLFRFPEIDKCQEIKIGHEREALAKKNSFRYTFFGGNIACLVNGIGLGWSTIDLLNEKGGQASCLLDVGTEPTANAITKALCLALSEPNVDGVLVNIFGGITSCKTIAEGLLNASGEIATGLPIVVRMAGLDADAGAYLLAKSVSPYLIMNDMNDAVSEIIKQVKEAK